MSKARVSLVLVPLLACMAGCATVTTFKPTSSVVSLTEGQSGLHKAAEAYCQDARERGLATGEASLGSLTAALTGKGGDEDVYWRQIGVGKAPNATVLVRIRTDLSDTASGLAGLNTMAREIIRDARPTRADVTRFELALIHGRQARASLADALTQVNETAARKIDVGAELAPLDAALTSARRLADDLAAARTSDEVATRAQGQRDS